MNRLLVPAAPIYTLNKYMGRDGIQDTMAPFLSIFPPVKFCKLRVIYRGGYDDGRCLSVRYGEGVGGRS